ncbi:MAG: DUF3995 domain-containing protein [Devosiaceae bacterium]|nr:DUF3995 domain-containing protein [Devosiaceae bacterium]
MTAGLASLIFIPLLAISMVHMLWAFGSTYPAKTQRDLARTVAGFKDIEKMPPRLASLAVSLATLFAGLWALALTDPNTSLILTSGGFVLTFLFLARGLVSYTSWWRALTPEQPFASFDVKVYGPLCLFIAVGFGLLTVLRVT